MDSYQACMEAKATAWARTSRLDEDKLVDLAADECVALKEQYLVAISACVPIKDAVAEVDAEDSVYRTLIGLKIWQRRHPGG
jgi:hypothetical protein